MSNREYEEEIARVMQKSHLVSSLNNNPYLTYLYKDQQKFVTPVSAIRRRQDTELVNFDVIGKGAEKVLEKKFDGLKQNAIVNEKKIDKCMTVERDGGNSKQDLTKSPAYQKMVWKRICQFNITGGKVPIDQLHHVFNECNSFCRMLGRCETIQNTVRSVANGETNCTKERLEAIQYHLTYHAHCCDLSSMQCNVPLCSKFKKVFSLALDCEDLFSSPLEVLDVEYSTLKGFPKPRVTLNMDFVTFLCKNIGGGGFGTVYSTYISVTKNEALMASNDEALMVEALMAVKKLSEKTPDLTKLARCLQKIEQRTVNLLLPLVIMRSNYAVYFIMEKGDMDLNRYIKLNGGTLSESMTLFIATQLASGLDVLHSANLKHCDIKPGNVMMMLSTATVKICDWDSLKENETCGIVSRGYTAYEVYRMKKVFPQSDIYSFGVTIVKCLGMDTDVGCDKLSTVDVMIGHMRKRDERLIGSLTERFMFVAQTLQENKDDRPTAEFILKTIKANNDVTIMSVANEIEAFLRTDTEPRRVDMDDKETQVCFDILNTWKMKKLNSLPRHLPSQFDVDVHQPPIHSQSAILDNHGNEDGEGDETLKLDDDVTMTSV